MQHKLSIVVPFWNEARSLPLLIDELKNLENSDQFEFIFVDDGSTDSSFQMVRQLADEHLDNSKIIQKMNGGKTSAVKQGIGIATGTHILILDADLELSPSDIPILWSIVVAGKSDVVFGYRKFYAHSSFTWRYSKGNKFISDLFGLLFNVLITDIMCGFKLLPTSLYKQIPLKSRRFGLEIEIPFMIWLEGCKIWEVEVSYSPRSRAEGKTIGVLDAVQVIAFMFWLRLRSLFVKKAS